MAIDFPASPATGQVFQAAGVSWKYTGTKWVVYSVGTPGAAIIQVGDVPPSVPVIGNAWFDTTEANLYVWWNDGTSSQWTPVSNLAGLTGPVGPAGPTGPGNGIGRSFIHNGLFNVAQRGAGPWTANSYTADRWYLIFASDTISTGITALADAGRTAIGDEAATYALQSNVTGSAAAGAYSSVAQWIEGLRRLAGKTITVSFWAAASSGTPKIGVSIDQWFGSSAGGGSPQVSGNGQSVTLSTTWSRYSLTFNVPSIVGKTISTSANDCTGVTFWYSSGSTNNLRAGNIGVQTANFYLWGVQLEEGTTATPLEKIDPRNDLANCQRFYQAGSNFVVGGYTASGSIGIYGTIGLPVTMRAVPTITLPGQSNGNVGTLGAPIVTSTSITFNAVTIAGGSYSILTGFTASADL